MLSSWWEAWHHPGMHGAGGAESSTSYSEVIQEDTGFQADRRNLKAHPYSDTLPLTKPHLLQQGYEG